MLGPIHSFVVELVLLIKQVFSYFKRIPKSIGIFIDINNIDSFLKIIVIKFVKIIKLF